MSLSIIEDGSLECDKATPRPPPEKLPGSDDKDTLPDIASYLKHAMGCHGYCIPWTNRHPESPDSTTGGLVVSLGQGE